MKDEELNKLKRHSESCSCGYMNDLVPKLIAAFEAAETALNEIRGMHCRESINIWLNLRGKK